MGTRYYHQNPEAPFSVLVRTVEAYFHPEAEEDGREALIRIASQPEKYPTMVTFKEELRRVILGDTEGLAAGALGDAAAYEDGSDEKFARRLWGELYPDEPVPGT